MFRYSFCRIADDLVDNAESVSEARSWISKLSQYLDNAYATDDARLASKGPSFHAYISENFPESAQPTLRLLPTRLLSSKPLYDLLEGFKMDLEFPKQDSSKSSERFPIPTENDLKKYAARVAGTVAELCLELVFHHTYSSTTQANQDDIVRAGGRMGIALQYVNISRDIATDAEIGRVYLPTSWLKDQGLTPQDIIGTPHGPAVASMRTRLLDDAFDIYKDAIGAIDQLPADASAPMRVAVESYMEIGRVLREKHYTMKKGRATVPKMRRLRVAWKALNAG